MLPVRTMGLGGTMHVGKRAALIITVTIGALVGALLGPVSAQASGAYPAGSTGVDISFPSCSSTIASGAAFGIVGVSGGRVYTDNDCAKAEAAHFPHLSLYINTGLTTGGTYFAQAMDYGSCNGNVHCGAYWYGFLAAVRAYNYANREHLQGVGTWWLDVELMNTWNDDTRLNAAAILGEHNGLAAMTATPAGTPRPVIGVYARLGEWNTITGGHLATRRWPVWFATGLTNRTTAELQQYCAPGGSFTAGPVQVVQWIGPGRLNDLDYGC